MAARLHQIEVTTGDPTATSRRFDALTCRHGGELGFRPVWRLGASSRRGPDGLRSTGPAHLCIQGSDIDALAARLKDGGWQAFGAPTDLGGNIRYQYAEDDDGLIIEAESMPHAAAGVGPWIAHVALATPERDRLVDWYAALTETIPRRSTRFGPNAKIDQLTGMADVEVSGAWLPAGDVEIEFWTYHAPLPIGGVPGPLGELTFTTPDLAAEVARLGDHGFVIADGAAIAHDPDGNAVRLIDSVR